MIHDLSTHLKAATRSVEVLERDGKPARSVILARTYDTSPDDLWDAVTNIERLPRWFAPVSGNLEPGGRFQIEGNASGTITECTPPLSFAATWEFGGAVSWIEVRVEPDDGDRARLTLAHIAHVDDEFWPKYGPGAAGVGWDLGLVGLAWHIADPAVERMDEGTFIASEQGRKYIGDVSEDWGRAEIESGESPEQARAAARRTAAFYTGQEEPVS